MTFGYAILYVADVPATLDHYEAAFGCARRMLHESGLYGELETGGTVLAFAGHTVAEMNDIAMTPSDPKGPAGPMNLTFVKGDVRAGYDRALANGASPVSPPVEKPWGQVACYVRDIDGHLIEIATPILERHGAESGPA